eukprot:7102375-Pyramimonas_sp.AAC.1
MILGTRAPCLARSRREEVKGGLVQEAVAAGPTSPLFGQLWLARPSVECAIGADESPIFANAELGQIQPFLFDQNGP